MIFENSINKSKYIRNIFFISLNLIHNNLYFDKINFLKKEYMRNKSVFFDILFKLVLLKILETN